MVISTPLILVVHNEKDEVLWSQRLNVLAKGFWFYMVGMFKKMKRLSAFSRLLHEKLGINSDISRKDAKFLVVYGHFYDDNVFDQSTSTHYIVVAYNTYIPTDEISKVSLAQYNCYI